MTNLPALTLGEIELYNQLLLSNPMVYYRFAGSLLSTLDAFRSFNTHYADRARSFQEHSYFTSMLAMSLEDTPLDNLHGVPPCPRIELQLEARDNAVCAQWYITKLMEGQTHD